MLSPIFYLLIYYYVAYSIVKDSNEDLGVAFWIVQNWPKDKAVCTKLGN